MKLSIPYVSNKYIRNKNFSSPMSFNSPKKRQKNLPKDAQVALTVSFKTFSNMSNFVSNTRSGDGQRLTRSCMLLFLPAIPPVKPTIVFNNKLY